MRARKAQPQEGAFLPETQERLRANQAGLPRPLGGAWHPRCFVGNLSLNIFGEPTTVL